jgi:hypothetical protein
MPLSDEFQSSATPRTEAPPAAKRKKRRPAPFCLRLSEEERQRLATEAGGTPLGAYIKGKVLGDGPVRPSRAARRIADRDALAKALALLGRSQLADNLQTLASAAEIGALPLDPTADAELRAALEGVHELRHLLMTAIGLRLGHPP